MITLLRPVAVALAVLLPVAAPSMADDPSRTRPDDRGRAGFETEMIKLDLSGAALAPDIPPVAAPGLTALRGVERDPRAALDAAVDGVILDIIPRVGEPAGRDLAASPQPVQQWESICDPWDSNAGCLVAETICDAVGGSWKSNPDGTYSCITFPGEPPFP